MIIKRIIHSVLRFPLPSTSFVAPASHIQIQYTITRLLANAQRPVDVTVYHGSLTPQIKLVKVFSLATSITGLAVQPVLYTELSTLNSVPAFVVVYSFVGFFTFVTPFLLHTLTKKYVTQLIYKPDSDKYEATTLSFFLIKQKVLFSLDDVTIPDVAGMFTTFVVNGKRLFVDPKMFQHPSHYGKIMGYDKPLDLKLYQTSLNEDDVKKKD